MILGCENVLKKIISYWELEQGKEAAVIFNQVYTNQSTLKEISPGCSLEGLMLKLKLQYLATWCEELTHLKRPWCWERLRAGEEGDDSGWDDWMASPTQWTWVWVDSGSWWLTGRPGELWFMGSQRVKHNWATEMNWTEYLLTVNATLIQILQWRDFAEVIKISNKLTLY